LSGYGSTPPPAPPPPPPPPPFGGYQQQGYGAAPSGTPLASWIQRVLAYLIDYALFLPFLVMQIVFSLKTVTTNVNGVENTTQSGDGLALLISLIGLAIWGYNRWHKGGQGQSLGKQVLGLTLVAESTGQPIGTGMAFVRDLAHFFDQLVCFIGFLFPLWDPKRQTIADKIMTTVVTTRA
jgi:uncharacterized RDD family membrane protein YckC